MQYTAAQIANFFLDKAKEDGIAITNLKLQKLVYICFGWVSAFAKEDLFSDSIQAWKYGPVIPSLYNQFSHLAEILITDQRAKIDGKIPPPTMDPKILSNLQAVYNAYAHLSTSRLIDYTHLERTPWNEVYEEGHKNEIPKAVIRRHYERLL